MSIRNLIQLVLLIVMLVPAFAGTYGPQNFESYPVGTFTLNAGDGTLVSSTGSTTLTSIQTPVGGATPRALRLTPAGTTSYRGAWKLPVLDLDAPVTSFDATFKCQLYNTANIADGFTFNFGAIPGGNDPGSGAAGFSMANGMYIAFDTYPASGGDGKQIRVYANGIMIGSAYTGGLFPANTSTFNTVVIHWDANGLDMTYNGAQVFLNRQLPGFIPALGNSFAFSARNGGVTEDVFIDDVQITTSVLPPITTSDVVISEFVADNGDGIEDEENDAEDWIELYNGTASPVDLNGWRLTNLATNNAMWTFPSVTIPPFNYLRVFASGKNRTSPVLHTNFTLVKAGGYLALVKPDATTKTSGFNYPQQSEDVSYGTYGVSQAVKFMYPPTPGTSNESASVFAGDGRPSEEVIFSREGGLFSGTVQLGVTAPLDPAAVIRYTTDGTVPTEASPVFSAATPLSISTSTQIRARTFQPGRLPGDVSSRTFLLLDSSLSNYATTGQPFQSNLPILVIESWGVNIDAVNNPAGIRPHRPVYTVALDKDPLSGNVASITALPNFQGRSGMHVRGQTSSDFGQKPYAWEVWTNEDADKNVTLLGMPADADWVLQTIYNDKTGMRNMLPQTLMQEVNGIGAAVRAKFVEVFFNQDGGPISYADYRGVYVLMEQIERGTDRVDISKLSPLATDSAVISGGYIFKKDKLPQVPLYSTTSSGTWGAQTHEIVEPDTASVVQVNALKNYVQAFDDALSGANFADPVLGYNAYIEPQTFMDNHLWVEVFKQIDGYRISTYYTKDRGQKIKALPIWDYNLSGGNANYGGPLNTTLGDNPVGWYYDNCGAVGYPYYPRLFEDNDFKQKYWDRYWKLRRGIFATSNVLGKVDAWANELTNNQYATNVTNGASVAPGGGDFFPTNKGNDLPPSLEAPARLESPIARHFDRWPVLGVYVWPNPDGFAARTTFQSEVQWMKDWLTNRLAWIDSQWNKPPNFSISGGNIVSGTSLTITNPNPGGVIYYTTDGTDPSVPGQQIYSSPLTIVSSSVIRARVLYNGTYGAVTEGTFIVGAQPASAANLVVAELCYDPAPSGLYSSKDLEFITLRNISPGNVDLTGVQLSAGVLHTLNGTTSQLTLPPGGEIVISANTVALEAVHGTPPPGVTVFGPFEGALGNSGELLSIRTASGSIIKEFAYAALPPWPSAAGGSLALQQPSSNPDHSIAYNWRFGSGVRGTPYTNDSVPFNGNWAADSNGDGYADGIAYTLGAPPQISVAKAGETVGAVTGDFLRITFTRSLVHDSGNTVPELSTELSQPWQSGTSAFERISIVNNGDGTCTETWRTLAPITSQRVFTRVKTTSP